jgi:hypothetical protein
MAMLSTRHCRLLILFWFLNVTNILITSIKANAIVHDDNLDDTVITHPNSHSVQHQQHQKSIPNSGNLMNNNDNDVLLPWYIDFLNLPSDGTFIPVTSSYQSCHCCYKIAEKSHRTYSLFLRII